MLKKILTLSIVATVLGLGTTVPASHAQVSDETPDFSNTTPADFAAEESIWVRDGVIPDYPNIRAPNADASIRKYGGLIVPTPPYQREDIQSQFIRDAEIYPDLYYPEGYRPVLMEHWPTDKPIFIPEELVPESMKSSPKEKSDD